MHLIRIFWSLILTRLTCAQTKILDETDIKHRSIGWANKPNPGSHEDYLVQVTVNGLDLGYVPIDTGSTGFLVSARSLHYDNDEELKKYCKSAFQYLSSSRRIYAGYWLPSTLAFKSITNQDLYSNIPVFAVTETGNCSSFAHGNCTKDQHTAMPTGIQYMGVGFGRWSEEQPQATADKNALLNIDFGTNSSLRRGYMISNHGLVVGLHQSDYGTGTSWKLTNLIRHPDQHALQNRPEWSGTPVCVRVDGSTCVEGTALFDTGINYSFLGISPDITKGLNVTDGKALLLRNGTEITVEVGSGRGDFNFSFTTGNSQDVDPITPPKVRLVKPHADGAFINTGRYFYNSYALLFDEESGVVGLMHNSPKVGINRKITNSIYADIQLEL